MIEFENVSFSYTGQEHGGLRDINLNFGRRIRPVLWPQRVRKNNDYKAGEWTDPSVLSGGASWPCAGRWSENQQYPHVSDCR
mgnify:CR=1 FL=1